MPWSPELSLPRWRSALAPLLAVGLAGCAVVPEPPAPAPPVVAPAEPPAPPTTAAPEPTPAPPTAQLAEPEPGPQQLADMATRRVLAYQERLRELAPTELAREQARLAEPASDPGQALELALLLSTTRQPGDLLRALGLVEPLARPGGPPAWRPIARLLQARLAEQRRLEEQAERQAQQLRDQQRRLDQLNSQLEALKNTECSLVTRPAAPPQPGAPGTRTP